MKSELLTYSHTEESIKEQDKPLAEEAAGMKKCPFCAEQIQERAIKCRYCGEFVDGSSRAGLQAQKKKWYFASSSVVIALLCLGPLALPLVWLNPRYKAATRAVITLAVLVVTVLCVYLMASAYRQLLDQLQELAI